MIRASFRLACVLSLAACSGLYATGPKTFTWTGAVSTNLNTFGNWTVEGSPATFAPTSVDRLEFGRVLQTNLNFSAAVSAARVLIGNSGVSEPLAYTFAGSTVSLALQGDPDFMNEGLRLAGHAKAAFGPNLTIIVGGSQTWYLETGTTAYVDGPLTSSGNVILTKDGPGDLHLRGLTSGLSGTMAVAGGAVYVDTSSAFAQAAVSISSTGRLVSTAGSGTTISSAVSLASSATLGSSTNAGGANKLVFTGTVTTGNRVVLAEGSQSYFEGALTAAAANTDVIFTGGGVAVLKGATAPTTPAKSFTVYGTGLVINTTQALPTVSLQAGSDGYLGMGAAFTSDPVSFISKISDPSTFDGTLGFDSDPSGAPNVFGAGKTIDVTGFASFRGLGSASHANLASDAVLNFSGDYQFGGGGGRLVVASALVAKTKTVEGMPVPVGLIVSSPAAAPLTLVLTGTNTFTGEINVDHSYLIFDGASALPTDPEHPETNPTITLGDSGYVSATPNAPTLTITKLLSRIGDSAETSVVGLDSSGPASVALDPVSDPISLGSFAGYVGTTTFAGDGLKLTATITGPTSGVLKLAGLNSGKLTVTSSLLSDNNITSLVVGHPDPELGRNGTVVLSGANTYTGGTTLRRGTLILGSSATDATSGPLGAAGASGKLTVDTYDADAPYSSAATLLPELSTVTLFNDILLAASSYLEIGRTDQSAKTLVLNGNITGSGTLQFVGPTLTTLGGTMSDGDGGARNGNTYLSANTTVDVTSNEGIHSQFLFLHGGALLRFGSDADDAKIGSLGSESSSVISFAAEAATLTINQTTENKYAGTFAPSGTLSLVKTGSANLSLAAPVTLEDLTVSQGLLSLEGTGTHNTSHAYLGTVVGSQGRVSVSSGTWAVSDYLKVGTAGGATGQLSVENGGKVTAPQLIIGYGAGSQGQVLVAGTGSSITAGSLTVASGASSAGALNIINGGSVSVTGAATLASTEAYLNIDNGAFSATSGLTNNGEINFNLDSALTFATDIGGSGVINKQGSGTLRLSGASSGFTGDLNVNDGPVELASNSAIGTAALAINATGSVAFTSPAPSIGSLTGAAGAAITLGTGSTLTVNQSDSSVYLGTITGSGALVYKGTGSNATLSLMDANTYTGGTTISHGAIVVAASNGALGTQGAVSVSGATLGVGSGVTLAFTSTHPLAFSSGQIGGVGTLALDGAVNSLIVGSGVEVFPGTNLPGTLSFVLTNGATFTFASDGTYAWRVSDNDGSASSLINVTGAVDLSATAGPFHLKLATVTASGSPAALTLFDSANPASWTILTASGGITGFDAGKFTIDASGFLNASDAARFSLTQTGNDLWLNFTPVPEPSTWVLMITGLATLTAATLRRRKRE